MHGILASLENLHTKSTEIFERIEAACGQADLRISALEERLNAAATRVDAARGSTEALQVQSARSFGRPRDLQAARLVVDEALLSMAPATLPETEAHTAEDLALDLARAAGSVTRGTPAPKPNQRLLPAEGRLSSVSELFLLNSSEQPYRARHEKDNLAEVDDFHEAVAQVEPARRESRVDLEEDEPDRATEDLRFRPRPAAPEVTFELPTVLPDLGHVAHITWSEGAEMERPAWDVPPAELVRAKPRPAAPVPAAPAAPVAPVITPVAAPPAAAPPAAPAAAPQPVVPSTAKAPPPPKVKGKGKGPKGKGKEGKAPPPPKKPSAQAPPKAPVKAEGKSAMFADIRAQPKLRKVAPPKERSGAAVGRVV